MEDGQMKAQHTNNAKLQSENFLAQDLTIELGVKPQRKVRVYSAGMGKAVADRTINRKILKKLEIPEIKKVKISLLKNLSLDQ